MKVVAELLGVSKPTVERWENGEKKITGPVVMLIDLLSEHDDWLENREIPEQKYSLRLWYMYKNKKCTLIDVDEVQQKIRIKNYVSNIMTIYRSIENYAAREFGIKETHFTMPKIEKKQTE